MNKISLFCVLIMTVFLVHSEQNNTARRKDREMFAGALIRTMQDLPQCCEANLLIKECQEKTGIAANLNPHTCSTRVHALEYYYKITCIDDSNKELCSYIKSMESSLRDNCKSIS